MPKKYSYSAKQKQSSKINIEIKLKQNIQDIKQEKGVSFLEILVVVAILGVTATFVIPNLGSWRNKALLEADVNALVSKIEYIKARASVINGTGVLKCSWEGPASEGGLFGNKLTYLISSYRQTYDTATDPNLIRDRLEQYIVEDGSVKNILSGKTAIATSMCGNKTHAIFLSSGQYFLVETGGGYLDIQITISETTWAKAWSAASTGNYKYPFYKILVEPMTSFVTKAKLSSKGDWIEIE